MFEQFKINKAMIQAPMAGITTPKFVAACCEVGILGSIGAGYLNGKETQAFIQEVKSLTSKPFSVNLFIQEEPRIDTSILQQARMALQPIYEELGINPTQRVVSEEVFDGQIQAILDENVPICTFTFGLPKCETIAKLKANGTYLIGTATTVQEALAVQAAGIDAVVIQGSEAGGHRGSFTDDIELFPTTKLLQDVVSKVSIPVIAAGGIMTAIHVKAMLSYGAAGVQIGTALLTATECEASDLHKNAILESREKDTTLTKAFTGKAARGLKNKFTENLKDAIVAPYPIQHYLTIKIRHECVKQQRPEYLSLWMGENSYMAKATTVQEIVDSLMD